jgi:hypothetical protein
MCTVLITYSTPPPPSEPTAAVHGHTDEGQAATLLTASATAPSDPLASVAPAQPSLAALTAGIDEAMAAAIADELTRAGHRVACRPSVAVTTTDGFDLVVAVHALRVSHSPRGLSRSAHPAESEPATAVEADGAPLDGDSTIPMTWCADWRAVDAWARSVGDHLVHELQLHTELVRVRAELDRCRAMLRAATPEPRPASTVELGRPVPYGAVREAHRPHRVASTRQKTGS